MKKITINPDKIDYGLIDEAAQAIIDGKIVAFPTETVYGLAARADKDGMAQKLYALKQRPQNKAFTIALAGVQEAVNNYLSLMPPFGYRLTEKFWPGPLTIIYFSPKGVSVGLRVPSGHVSQSILARTGLPVYLPSANLSGHNDSVTAAEVESEFDGNIDLIVDAGPCEYGRSSTVLDMTFQPFRIVREGVIPENDIVETFIRKRLMFVCTGNTCRSPMAEMMLRKYLAEGNLFAGQRYEIISRGIAATAGHHASGEVIDILRDKEGIEARQFISARLGRQMLLSSDLIIVMEAAQKEHLLKMEPSLDGRLFTMSKFLPQDMEQDIPDPIGGTKEDYQATYELLRKAVLELRDWL
jgi:tRNA threonylcarbamoyl adenosine modification protein (Sua5/YciO/YrdC/YwlC family)